MARQKRKGFTLSELVVVLAVSVIILLIVFSLIATLQKHSQFRAASVQVRDELNSAQLALERAFSTLDSAAYPAPETNGNSGGIVTNPALAEGEQILVQQDTSGKFAAAIYLRFNPEQMNYEIVYQKADGGIEVIFRSERITGLSFAKCVHESVDSNNNPTETPVNENFVLCTITYHTTTDTTDRHYTFTLWKHSENATPTGTH